MANIEFNDLLSQIPTGAELFNDSESFMKDIREESEEMEKIFGGAQAGCILPTCKDTLEGCWRNTLIKTIFVVAPDQDVAVTNAISLVKPVPAIQPASAIKLV